MKIFRVLKIKVRKFKNSFTWQIVIPSIHRHYTTSVPVHLQSGNRLLASIIYNMKIKVSNNSASTTFSLHAVYEKSIFQNHLFLYFQNHVWDPSVYILINNQIEIGHNSDNLTVNKVRLGTTLFKTVFLENFLWKSFS